MTTRNGSIIDNTYDGDTSHPERGNFVLMNDGRAYYGGALYYRHGLAPQSAVKPKPNPEPSPRYQPGDRISVISGDTYGEEVPAGTVGTVIRDLGKGVWPVDVRLEDDDFEYPFEYDEVEPYTEPEPEPDQPAPLAVNDRVVYTPPAEFMGESGTRWATPGLVGELGTVVEAPYAGGVRVRWDNAGSLRNSIEFVQRAPEYREVTYRSNYDAPYRHYGIQRTSDGRLSCTDNRVPSHLDKFRAEAPLDKAALRPYIIRGAVTDIQPL